MLFSCNNSQAKTTEFNTLNEIASTLKRVADADSLQEIETKQNELNGIWNNLALNLKRQKSVYENLANRWTAFNQSTAGVESELANCEDQVNRIDKVVRSRQQLQEKEVQIQVSELFGQFSKSDDNKYKYLTVLNNSRSIWINGF